MSRTSRVFMLAVLIGVMLANASVSSAAKVVRYHGFALRVPSSWPVFDLRADPRRCVRFDRHAVYLGQPGVAQQCPAHAVGRTEAILVAPLGAATARGGATPATALPTGGTSTRIIRRRAQVAVTATWRSSPGTVARALGLAAVHETGPSTNPAAILAHAASAVIAHAGAVTRGLGFDPCATPSTAAMSAWRVSPYHTVGVYLGGTNMACAQPNLTTSWVRSETAAGWHFIPTYVGLQAPGGSCGSCATIVPGHAAAEGAAAATDAVGRAQAVGLGRGNPIYFDMEAYSTGGSATAMVRSFLSAWTTTLHADGYLSGVYSSAASGISDLVAGLGGSFVEPDDIWIANWNGTHSTRDPYVPDGDWPAHQRIHQFSGGQDVTYGGVTINIDGDYVDGATASAGASVPDSTFVQVSGTPGLYRIAGGAPLFVSDPSRFGAYPPITTISQDQFASLNQVPADGTFLTTTSGHVFRVAGGAPLGVTSWSMFGGIPQPSVTIDEWDIDNIANPLAHLRALPVPGTLVEGLPSNTYWRFVAGGRVPTAPSALATPVDDFALLAYTVLSAASGGGSLDGLATCVVPALRRMTLAHARQALRSAHCALGSVRRPRHARHHVLRVASQSPRAGTRHSVGYAVRVTVR